jgi:hypothetical protein
MTDNVNVYKDQVKQLQVLNDFVRNNTLNTVIKRIEYLRDERTALGLPVHGVTMSLDIVKAML